MRRAQIDAWVYSVLDRLQRHEPIEEWHVELKGVWPTDHAKAARRIAGLANAARGEPTLLLIGVDEKTHAILGATATEFTAWWGAIGRWFDQGVIPTVTDQVVMSGETPLVALVFATDRAPYVVRNPTYGVERGEAVEREVPWREGTSVRSARRDDLVRILVPAQLTPDAELVSASAGCSIVEHVGGDRDDEPELSVRRWSVEVTLYLIPRSRERVVLPNRRAELSLSLPGIFDDLRVPIRALDRPYRGGGGTGPYRPMSETIVGTGHEVLVDGPGMLRVHSEFSSRQLTLPRDEPIRIMIRLHPLNATTAIVLSATLPPADPDVRPDEPLLWSLNSEKPTSSILSTRGGGWIHGLID